MATLIIRPVSDSDFDLVTNSDDTTTDLWSYVDEAVVSESDYIQTDGLTSIIIGYVEFDWGSTGLTDGDTINKITLKGRASSSTGNDSGVQFRINIGSSPYQQDYFVFPTVGEPYDIVLVSNTNPNTSGSWTASELNSLIAGIEAYYNGIKTAVISVYQMYIEVDYTPGAAADPTISGLQGISGIQSITF